ncbi:MAG TPA: hypothetical protein VKB46_19025, partial [Pyrinomonadaceae bacterium]|nr:hypothetical protein [Pyrinomonadaceae bacterium]
MARQDKVQQASGLCPSTAQRWLVRLALVISLSFVSTITCSAQTQSCVLQGTVGVSSSSGSTDRLPGASLSLIAAETNKAPLSTVS